jgi:hypothetical protein
MRKRVEEDEVVTAWRVVKRRMAKGAARARRRKGRGGATVYDASRVGRGNAEGRGGGEGGGRAQQGRRATRGPRRSRSSRSLSLVAVPSPLLLAPAASPCFLRPCFYSGLSRSLPPSLPPSLSPSRPLTLSPSLTASLSLRRFLAPLPLSVPAITSSLSLSHSLAIVPSSARGVFRGKRGQAWSTDPRMACSCLLTPRASPIPLILRLSYLPVSLSPSLSLSLSFSVLISLFLRRSRPRRGFSLRVALPPRVLFSPPYIPRDEESSKTGERGERRRAGEGLASRVLCTRYQGRE